MTSETVGPGVDLGTLRRERHWRDPRNLIATDASARAEYYRNDSERIRRVLARAVEMMTQRQIEELAKSPDLSENDRHVLRQAWREAPYELAS